MSSDPTSEAMKLARACPADWDALCGGSQARTCALCRQTLFDTTAMAPADRAAFEAEVASGKGRAKLFLRRDGTVMKRDCPAGRRVAQKRFKRAVLALLVVGLLGEGALFHQLDAQLRERDEIEQWCGCAVTSDRMLEHLKYLKRHQAGPLPGISGSSLGLFRQIFPARPLYRDLNADARGRAVRREPARPPVHFDHEF
jgi:hypothetical protein